MNYLAEVSPNDLVLLKDVYPGEARFLKAGKILGAAAEVSEDLVVALCRRSLRAAEADLHQVSTFVAKRTRLMERVKLTGNIISSASSTGVVAAILQGNSDAAIYIAAITFLSSLCLILVHYYDRTTNGGHSFNQLQEMIGSLRRDLAIYEGEFALMDALGDIGKVEVVARKVILLVAELTHIKGNLF